MDFDPNTDEHTHRTLCKGPGKFDLIVKAIGEKQPVSFVDDMTIRHFVVIDQVLSIPKDGKGAYKFKARTQKPKLRVKTTLDVPPFRPQTVVILWDGSREVGWIKMPDQSWVDDTGWEAAARRAGLPS